MSWLSSLFGSSKAIDTGCDLAKDLSSGLDVLVTTDEELIQYRQKATDQYLEYWRLQQDANSVRSEARRSIAVIVVCIWASYFLSTLLCIWLRLVFAAMGKAAVAKVFAEGATQFMQNTNELSWVMGAVMTFYFIFDESMKSFDSWRKKKNAAVL